MAAPTTLFHQAIPLQLLQVPNFYGRNTKINLSGMELPDMQ
jgi:hypothetical protein